MSSKSVIGSIIGSVLITMGIIWGLAFVGFLPGVDTKNTLIQTQYGEWNSPAYVFDYQLTPVKMPETEINITVNADSRLYVSFSAMAILSLTDTFIGRQGYNISLGVENIGNRTIQANYYDDTPAVNGLFRQISLNLYINYMTPRLLAGTYKVEVYWNSMFDALGDNSLSVAHSGGFTPFNFTRTLLVQELSA
jgi:hypothetical protein